MAEDLTEEALARFATAYRVQAGNPRLVLHPTQMILRPDLSDEEVRLACQIAEEFSHE